MNARQCIRVAQLGCASAYFSAPTPYYQEVKLLMNWQITAEKHQIPPSSARKLMTNMRKTMTQSSSRILRVLFSVDIQLHLYTVCVYDAKYIACHKVQTHTKRFVSIQARRKYQCQLLHTSRAQ